MGADEEHLKYLNSPKFKELLQQEVIKDTWGRGLPMVYMNKDGQIVKHWADGRMDIIKDNQPSTCKKVHFRCEQDALYSLEKIKKTSKKKVIPVRAYLCKCGFWHLTSKASAHHDSPEELKQRIGELEKEINNLKQRNNREENVAVKSNSRIKSLTLENESLRRENAELKTKQ